MRVLLISANTERRNMPTLPLGLAMVAEATRRAGHEVRFLDLLFEERLERAIRKQVSSLRPEVIGISVRNIDDQEMADPDFLLAEVRPVVAACRRLCPGATIVLGGAGFSIFPRPALAYLGADLGIWGDGEQAFPALLERLRRGADPMGLPGVVVPGEAACPGAAINQALDEGLLPVEELWSSADPHQADLWVPVQGRRGCANDCSYCSTARIQGRAIRSQSPQTVVKGLARLKRAGFRQFYIVDSSFNIPEGYGLELCQQILLARLQIRWRCIIYPHRLSVQLVQAMAVAGCVEVALGFESGSQPVLRRMNKRFTPDDVRRAADLLAEHGIRRVGFLLLGGPGETRETVEQSLAFAESLRLEALRITVGIRIYPGTPLAQVASQEGLIDPDDDLLRPRFYLAPGLEPWIHERVSPGFRVPAR